jgi:hypothetical protein
MKTKKKKSALVIHAERELELAFADPDNTLEENEKALNNFVKKSSLDLISMLSSHGHGGLTSSLVSDIFAKLSRYLPLTPLSGDDNEWTKPDDTGLMQNIRYAGVFKDKDGHCYDTNARVFISPEGEAYIDPVESCKDIEFPYYPSIEYVQVMREPDEVKNESPKILL